MGALSELRPQEGDAQKGARVLTSAHMSPQTEVDVGGYFPKENEDAFV